MIALIIVVVAVIALGILKTFIAGKLIKTVFKVAVVFAIAFCAVVFIYTGSMPTQETLETTKATIVTQLREEVKKNGEITASLEDKVEDYNALVDKAKSFQDNKFIGGFIKYDLENLKIDLSDWE